MRVGLWRNLSAEELMVLNCSVGRLLRVAWTAGRSNQSILKEISPGCSLRGLMLKLKLQYFGHLMWRVDSWKRPWIWEWLGAGGEKDDKGSDDWMASPTQWACVSVDSGTFWWTWRPGMLRFMESQRVRHDWAIELTELMQSISCEMQGWMKHKLESRLLGEISITTDMQMTPPLWQKVKRN